MVQLLQAWLLAITIVKALKFVLALSILVLAYNVGTDTVDALVVWLGSFDDPVVMGVEMPLISGMAYVGMFDLISVLLGAHVVVFGYRLLSKAVEWLA